MSAEAPAPASAEVDAKTAKKRPRLDMAVEPRERKRGKTAFGLLLGTLAKAKDEAKERNASEAARRRQQIEKKTLDKLRKETDSVRRAEEAKKDKTTANRKEEELQLKDSIHKLRRTRLPLLANFLLTSDVIPPVDSDSPASTNPLVGPPKARPPPLYYLPAKLLPSQTAFLQRRKAEVQEAAEKEWEQFKAERAAGVEEINRLRERVAEEESRRKTDRRDPTEKDGEGDAKMVDEGEEQEQENKPGREALHENGNGDASMAVDDGAEKEKESEEKERKEEDVAAGKDEKKDEKKSDVTPTPGPGYDDDAVEY
ncbi:hypothetical protein BD309DRAFT_1044550 [Dichomitus squalens]|uniref:Pinin/SDK/MemA protein domain-containing protein n=2 Tax=Dichomitus squalens TaxID=114155 RepID=A0A4Q9NMB5_9APHY|nr:uncharacterized protein DICSQDRAFT_69711 [Dichomitus squalens LYAD-421 SS1]EJF57335.1 hypothetical protein DICSQDRAFT_69711 [Dichomitus squalens LYAD-421 SS1]TBU26533.1 hypothetical protein BD311DRAFT_779569 [Dichomitus squalens]TBU40851.1 hypothetical protein BD309DRAFT_1044550 [Dichomitus squalens]TBU51909.1 hypothetical protein BD310DRAFT_833329 [Dichomitus squalens]